MTNNNNERYRSCSIYCCCRLVHEIKRSTIKYSLIWYVGMYGTVTHISIDIAIRKWGVQCHFRHWKSPTSVGNVNFINRNKFKNVNRVISNEIKNGQTRENLSLQWMQFQNLQIVKEVFIITKTQSSTGITFLANTLYCCDYSEILFLVEPMLKLDNRKDR